MRAKKSLGQHFLRSRRALDKIIEAGNLNAGDMVIEIGPGEGILTERLLKVAGKVTAVEKDDQLFEFLKEKFSKEIGDGNLDLVSGDVLKFEATKLEKLGSYKLIANIPYNITGAVLEKFLSSRFQPSLMVLLVQKEVAQRIIARDKKESILSISIKAYGRPRYVETVRAGSFAPMPAVDSAIIAIENISRNFFQEFGENDFFKILRAGFRSKRKKLSSNLATILGKDKVGKIFETLHLDENLRAENATTNTWKEIINNWYRLSS